MNVDISDPHWFGATGARPTVAVAVEDGFTAAGHATGLVAMLLLTATVVLGILHSGRVSSAKWPRFAVHAVHRNASLLAIAFLVVHIVVAIGKPGSGLSWPVAVVPYSTTPHPIWLGMGTVALELLLAAIVTGLLRLRIGFRWWRAVHAVAYASWPLALAHGLGLGTTDRRLGWVMAVYLGCAVAVAAAITRRCLTVDADRDARRAAQAGQR
ncbi:ferric reductase-like transmembrane domain-containing protein [Pseudonocardia alaniniphila]|uniref:Ferric reductase-like transmembrane domain-containing protein n=1 Tax=Pseudonocardia alaniniphila TaxID=75291 RepID=A0ABS9T6Z5_9PSEU|nr:ferric reductase-like transmembrane domain-containing protein [Pseudonocardia alaniniphila]MCH6164294.1 ferric reductase-like transmembrane domain-containing protein [Pseudonocardia alaniniphila]